MSTFLALNFNNVPYIIIAASYAVIFAVYVYMAATH